MKKGDKVIIESSNEKGVVMYVNTTTNRASVKMEDGTARVFPFDVLKSVAKKYAKGGYLEYRGTITDDAIKNILQNDFPNANYQLDFNFLNGSRVYAQKDVLQKIRKQLINEYGIEPEIEHLDKFGLPYIYIPNQIIEKMAKGGNSDVENNEMVLNNNKQIAHHTKELPNAIKGKKVPAWVVAKVNRSASDLSDASHYMDGQGNEYANGGLIDLSTKEKASMYSWLDKFLDENNGNVYMYEEFAKKFDKSEADSKDIIDNGWALSRGYKDSKNRYDNGGRLTSNEDIIEAFLTSNREAKVGNLETTYSTLGAVVLLRNYGTLIAKRRGNTVSISNKKYSMTTTKIQNMIERIANRMGLKVEKIDENKFALGGNTSTFEYSIGGL